MSFDKNLCPCGRGMRIVLGLMIASLAFWGPESYWFLLGLAIALFGAIGHCPLSRYFKKADGASCTSSCRCKDKKE